MEGFAVNAASVGIGIAGFDIFDHACADNMARDMVRCAETVQKALRLDRGWRWAAGAKGNNGCHL